MKNVNRLGIALVLVGCYHGIDGRASGGGDNGLTDGNDSGGGEASDGGSGPGDDDLPPPPASCAGEEPPTAVQMARLTHYEYAGTLRALFGDTHYEGFADALAQVPADIGMARIDRLSQAIGLPHVTGFFQVAERVGEFYENDPAARGELVGCLDAGDDAGCIRTFIADFGRRVYRRPLSDGEVEELGALFDGAAQDGPGAGLRQVLAAMLQAPDFIFHVELGDAVLEDGSVELSRHELASRLSYYVWGLPPDPDLIAAADAGELDTDAGLDAQRERLLGDARAHVHFEHFADQWLGLTDVRSFEAAPDYRAEGLDLDGADDAARRELLDLVGEEVWERDASFADLMTTDLVVAEHPALAAIYDVSPGPSPVEVDAARHGLLARLGFLGSPEGRANPILRGRRVSRDLLCVEMAPPDQNEFPDGAFDPLEPDGSRSSREAVELMTTSQACAGCHAAFNHFGFALEDHDGLGRERSTEIIFDDAGERLGEVPVDAAVSLPLGDDAADVDGTVELSAAIGESDAARQCLSKRWFAFAAAREPDSADDCLVDWQADTLAEAGGMAGLIRLSTARPQFRLKLPFEGE